MKPAGGRRSLPPAPSGELAELRARLAEAEETLGAIRAGEVDAVVVNGRNGAQIFTLEGAEHGYRVLIEAMNEGALTLAADKTILYANQRFAMMVRLPLEKVIGGSFHRFLPATDRPRLRRLMKRTAGVGSQVQVLLYIGDGPPLPAQLSIRALARDGADGAAFGMVVTDLTESRQREELLRALSHRLVKAQEAERGRVALELHDHITQLLCAILVRCQALADRLSERDGPSRVEAMTLRAMLGEGMEEVERISRDLRPAILDQLGLVAALRATGREFAARAGVALELDCVPLAARLPADTELTLFRILEEALHNIEAHAHARHVHVGLRREGSLIHLVIRDDGTGFDPNRRAATGKATRGLGLLSIRERAMYVGGTLSIKSGRRIGTEIEVRIPMPPPARAGRKIKRKESSGTATELLRRAARAVPH